MAKVKRTPTVVELQALLPVSREDRLRALVVIWRGLAQHVREDAKAAAGFGHYHEGFAAGEMLAYNEAAEALELRLNEISPARKEG